MAAVSGASRARALSASGPWRAMSARGSTVISHRPARRARRWASSATLLAALTTRIRLSPEARDHEVVEDAAGVTGEETVALPAGRQPQHVDGQEGFEGASEVRHAARTRLQPDLAHMRHVEQTGRLAGVQVFGDQAGRIMERQRITREGHHAGAVAQMEHVKRCAGSVERHLVTP